MFRKKAVIEEINLQSEGNKAKPCPEKALKNATKAIQLWIDTAKEFDDLIPAPKGKRLIFA